MVAIGDLAGADATSGLRAPTITDMRFVVGTTATTDLTAGNASQTITVELTWDEGVTVAGSPTIVVTNGNQGAGTGRSHTHWSTLQLVQLQTERDLLLLHRQSLKMTY